MNPLYLNSLLRSPSRRQAFEELETLLARDEICIAVKERLVKDSGEAPASAYDAIVARLLSRPRARGGSRPPRPPGPPAPRPAPLAHRR